MSLLWSLLLLNTLQVLQALEYYASNELPNSPGGLLFEDQIGEDYAKTTLKTASQFIWKTFKQPNDTDRKHYEHVSVLVEDNSSVIKLNPAYTVGGDIHLNTKFIATYNSGDLKQEITGVIYHEATHIWQWTGNGQPTPKGLIEGIADYVRLKANLAPPMWEQVLPGEGKEWKQGFIVTARFLDYCNSLKDGFVADLNRKMKDGYNDSFFSDLLGKSVDELWKDYKANYGKKLSFLSF